MHTLNNWSVRRSGARMTVHGFNEAGERVKIPAVEIMGPCDGRLLAPTKTIAVQPNGDSLILETL